MSDSDMMSRIQEDLVAAMKARDADTLSTLRMLKSALMEARTKKPRDAGLSADEEIEILQRYVKKRRETIDEMRKAGRDDLVVREEREIEVTMRYLPRPLDEEALRGLVRQAIETTGAGGPRDTGKVIGIVMGQVKGRAEGALVSRLVKQALGGGSPGAGS